MYVLYEGPSRIDGQPIVVVATAKTRNKKTGDMIQTWILRSDLPPVEAINTGADESICGDCPLRGIIAMNEKLGKLTNQRRPCYVEVGQAPQAIWKAWKRGSYQRYDHSDPVHRAWFQGQKLRMGSYGDPAAVPLTVWKPLIRLSAGRTGYTHQWRDKRFTRLRQYVMASTESDRDTAIARAAGWRTFRTRKADDPVRPDEIVCPASPEGGDRRQCANCLACDGGSTDKRSVTIVVHGSKSKLSSYDLIELG